MAGHIFDTNGTDTSPLIGDESPIKSGACTTMRNRSRGQNSFISQASNVELQEDAVNLIPVIPFCRHLFPFFFPGNESLSHIITGCTAIATGGTLMGLFLHFTGLSWSSEVPSDTSNSRILYAYIHFLSPSLGYTYFLAWSISFYPQLLTNARTRSTSGLSADFTVLNFCGFSAYMGYTLNLFYDPIVRATYAERHDGAMPEVRGNDVGFAIHAWLLTAITLGQIAYFDGFRGLVIRVGRISWLAVAFIVVWIALSYMLEGKVLCIEDSSHCLKGPLTELDFCYQLAVIKMGITVTKYCPQAWHNYTRKSTDGWNIWGVILDFMGGILSVLQLVFDCAATGHWDGITGDLVKFGLGFTSIIFDVSR
uniref:Uncharacterized protein n=1 Tax=Corethron hystrix TaxID=216773 RepID=A0A7S1FP28_9STRA|mmetsp:Transcript_16408/g.36896  ORF Transcript_16408/g.36896 Transcript_16408/m.36896 type:complete len:366 (+) Transcript_16408:67-1164(+)